MRHFLIFTCILSVLTTTGYCLSCIQCVRYNNASCSGPTVLCPSEDDSCLSSLAVTFTDGKEVSKIISRRCEKHIKCNKYGSVSIFNSQMRSSSTCCFTDNCTPETPDIILDNTIKNGVYCTSCTATHTNACTGKNMECTGNETKCFNQVTTISVPIPTTVVVRGCANAEICYTGNQVFEVEKLKVNSDISCTNGSRSDIWPKLMKITKL